jgi:hypothetical protein
MHRDLRSIVLLQRKGSPTEFGKAAIAIGVMGMIASEAFHYTGFPVASAIAGMFGATGYLASGIALALTRSEFMLSRILSKVSGIGMIAVAITLGSMDAVLILCH